MSQISRPRPYVFSGAVTVKTSTHNLASMPAATSKNEEFNSMEPEFSIRFYNPDLNPMPCIEEIPLKLARKKFTVFGASVLHANSIQGE